MTRKDYILLATALTNARPPCLNGNTFTDEYRAWFACVANIAHKLHQDNARFDTDRFFAACGHFGTTIPEGIARASL